MYSYSDCPTVHTKNVVSANWQHSASVARTSPVRYSTPKKKMETIANEMAAWMDKNGVKTLDEIRGCARHAE